MDYWFSVGVLGIVLCGTSVTLLYCLVTGISPVPSSRGALDVMIGALPADTIGAIYELGAGWGALAFPLALEFPQCEVFAYELSPFPWFFMTIRARLSGRANLTIRRGDIHTLPIKDASAVFMYLHSECVEKLKPRFENELAVGTLVVSNTFEVPDWVPHHTHELDDTMCPQVLVYRTPPRRQS